MHDPFDAQPKIMAEIIAAEGGASTYMQTNCKKLSVDKSSDSDNSDSESISTE